MTHTDSATTGSAPAAPVWLVRAGSQGEDEAVALESGLAMIGFTDIPDLTAAGSSAEVSRRVGQANPDAQVSRNRNRAAQLTKFLLRMRDGDIVALPLKTRPGRVALGRVTGAYRYQKIDGVNRHTRPVKWIRPDIPRSDFRQDLLYSLGAFMTVCRIQRNGAEVRIAAILAGSRDPGDPTEETPAPNGGDADTGDDAATPNIARIAHDQILDLIRSRFTGHDLARLVDAVLQAEGYSTLLSPAGPDGGVDILAGRGSLGFEGPRICVQVKATADPADVNVLRALQGTMQSFNAEYGLLVSWGGFTRALEREARQGFFTVRLWRADDLVSAIYRNYDRLSEQIQTEIPLERVWTLVREDSDL